jgi:hypothetical protein
MVPPAATSRSPSIALRVSWRSASSNSTVTRSLLAAK